MVSEVKGNIQQKKKTVKKQSRKQIMTDTKVLKPAIVQVAVEAAKITVLAISRDGRR